MAEPNPYEPKGFIDNPPPATRRLLLFGVSRLDQVLAKGNVWYVRHYESYFDEVYVIYLHGRASEQITQGRTTLISVGGRVDNFVLDLALAPFRLYRVARKLRPGVYLTADLFFSWWTALLTRLLLRARIVLMPVAIPEQLHADRGRSMTGLPIRIERAIIRWSFRACYRVYTARAFGDFVEWLSSHPIARNKLILTDSIAEALPSQAFFDRLRQRLPQSDSGRPFTFIFVGRLHPEKLVDHLLVAFRETLNGTTAHEMKLVIIGDGDQRPKLEQMARDLGIEMAVEFRGAVPNAHLPDHLQTADAFVSTLTGTSLREAALCGLPIVAYERDWVRGLLKDEETALMVSPGDKTALAAAMLRIVSDHTLREKIAVNAMLLGETLWSPAGVKEALSKLHAVVAS